VKALAALMLLLALAGCGGAAGDGDFAERAVAICTDANERIRALGAPESFTATQLYARQAKDAVGDELDDLRELSPPADRADSFDVYLVTLEERQRLLGKLADAADATSMSDVRGVGTEIANLDTTAREHATAAGIAECEPQ
jgi:hypothetical protein